MQVLFYDVGWEWRLSNFASKSKSFENKISFPSFFGGRATAQRVSRNAIFRQDMKACPHVDLTDTIHLFVCWFWCVFWFFWFFLDFRKKWFDFFWFLNFDFLILSWTWRLIFAKTMILTFELFTRFHFELSSQSGRHVLLLFLPGQRAFPCLRRTRFQKRNSFNLESRCTKWFLCFL